MPLQNNKTNILFIDDIKLNLVGYKRMFSDEFNIFTAESGQAAIEVLKNETDIQVIISDQRMPVMTGVVFFEKIKHLYPDIIRMISTSYDDLDTVVDAVNKGGIYYYFQKPLDIENVKIIVKKSLESLSLKKRLIESEQLNRSTFDQAAIGIIRFDLNHQIMDTNSYLLKLLGYKQGELINRSVNTIQKLKIKTTPVSNHQNSVSTYEEKQYVRKDGSLFWGKSTLSTIINNMGSIEYFLEFVEDISEQKKFKTDLIESENRFRDISFSMADWIWEIDLKGNYTYAGTRIKELLGFDKDEVIGKSYLHYILDGEFKKTKSDFDTIFSEEKPIVDLEKWCAHINNQPVCLLSNGFPIKNCDGELIGYRGVDKNITQQKITELELTRHRDYLEKIAISRTDEIQKLSRAVEQSPVSVVITDKDGIIEYVNPKFVDITGFTLEEAVGKTPRILKSGKHPKSLYQDLWRTIKSGEVWKGELTNLKKNGDTFWESISISPIRNTDNLVTHFVAVKEDITEKKRAEVELNRKLKQLASSRSAMLNMMEDLEVARKAAESAALLKSSFLANMSHEIRTPMNAILGFLGLAMDDPSLTSVHSRNLSIAYDSAKGLLNLINNILDISKLESDKMELDLAPFSLKILLNETIRTLKIPSQEKKVIIDRNIEANLSDVYIGDMAKLKQILINLVGNAIKFTNIGSIVVKVEKDVQKDFLRFSIKDTGIGISEKRLKMIFDPFIQADISTSRRFGGTGLGTTISRQLVELMSGKIWVESKIDEGSTFHFTANLQETIKSPMVTSLSGGYNEVALDQSPRSFNILVAEDIEANRQLAKIRLEQQGHSVLLAENGEEAVMKFQTNDVDVILMDIQMPKLNGIDVTKIIREKHKNQDISIIAMTASIMQEDIELYKQAGINKVIGKPINFAQLFMMMENVIATDLGTPNILVKNALEFDQSETAFPKINGINAEKGLRLWKNKIAYKKALLDFIQKFQLVADELAEVLKQDDMKEALFLSHSLKGVSGNIAAGEITNLASDIELNLKNENKEAAIKQLPILKYAVQKLANSAKVLVLEEKTETEKKKTDPLKIKTIFQQVTFAFDSYNPDVIKSHLKNLSRYLPDDYLNPVIKTIEQYDFDEGKKQLLYLAEKLELKLKD